MKTRLYLAIAGSTLLSASFFAMSFACATPFGKTAAVLLGVICAIDALFGVRFLKNLPPSE